LTAYFSCGANGHDKNQAKVGIQIKSKKTLSYDIQPNHDRIVLVLVTVTMKMKRTFLFQKFVPKLLHPSCKKEYMTVHIINSPFVHL